MTETGQFEDNPAGGTPQGGVFTPPTQWATSALMSRSATGGWNVRGVSWPVGDMSGSTFQTSCLVAVAWVMRSTAGRVNAAAELAEAGVPGGGGRPGAGCPVRCFGAPGVPLCGSGRGRRACGGARGERGVHGQAAGGAGQAGTGRCARARGTISAVVVRALTESVAGPQRASPQVSDRAVGEPEFVFDRHAATDLSVAYAIPGPRRGPVSGPPGRTAAP